MDCLKGCLGKLFGSSASGSGAPSPKRSARLDLSTKQGKEKAEALAKGTNPYCPLCFAFEDAETYKQVFGTRHHTTQSSEWSGGSNGPVPRKGHIYDDKVGTDAALYVSKKGEAPTAMTDPKAQCEYLFRLSNLSAVKVGGWGSGMKDLDYYNSLRQIMPEGDTHKSFYDKYSTPEAFTMKDETMRGEYLKCLVKVVRPLIDGMLEGQAETVKYVVHWDGDEMWDTWAKSFNTYAPLVYAIAACLTARQRLEGLLCVKNARTKWTKRIGSEAPSTDEEQWYKTTREKADGTGRPDFTTKYFRDSKIDEMIKFIKSYSSSADAPDFACVVHSTEKNRFAAARQDGSHFGYFGASVQCAMAQGKGATSTVVMLGGGGVIYNELSNTDWAGAAKEDKHTKGYKPGTKVVAFDVKRKAQADRCKVFDKEGEPETIFKRLAGKVITV